MSYDVYKTKVLKRLLEILLSNSLLLGFPGGIVVKNLPANAGNTRLIIGSGRSPTEQNGNPLSILPGKSHEQRNMTGYSPRGHKKS